LRQGHYSLKLTVRDNVGNQTVATSRFEVVGKLTLRDVFCYPNPFQPARGARFAYTLTESVNNVTIRIFGMDGKLVREIDGTASVGENLIPWDGKDEAGELVLSSVYICRIEAEGSQETVVETIKIAGWE
jgi:flagellar hook assembly protein FlgD